MFNWCLTFRTFPRKLKLAIVIPLLKQGCPEQLNYYHPFPLLPSLPKVFERLIYNRFLSFFTQNNTIVQIQYGFKNSGRGTKPTYIFMVIIPLLVIELKATPNGNPI